MSVSPIADMIETMAHEGAPLPAIVIAVRAYEASHVTSHSVTCDAYSGRPSAVRMRRKRNKDQHKMPIAKANDVAIVSVTSSVTSSVTCDNTADDYQESKKVVVEQGSSKKEQQPEFVEGQKKVSRGTRMAAATPMPGAYLAWTIDYGKSFDIRLVEINLWWDEFVDFWAGVPGQRGLKTDWLATWRNRVREKCGRKAANGQRTYTSNRTTARASNQDTLINGMAAALSERADSRLGGSGDRGTQSSASSTHDIAQFGSKSVPAKTNRSAVDGIARDANTQGFGFFDDERDGVAVVVRGANA